MGRTKPKHRAGGPESSQTLRIIGGDFRGSLLWYHGDPVTRPMKERVREATFNLLGPAVKSAVALDLFAGTGALGLEALSRGASRCVLIERHFPTVRLIGQNVKHLGVSDQAEIVTGDTFFWCLNPHKLPQITQSLGKTAPWIVFCSPPYQLYVDRAEEMMTLLDVILSECPAGSIFVVEADERFDGQQLPATIQWDHRAYSPAHLFVAEKRGA